MRIPLPIYALAIQGTKNWRDVLQDFHIVPQPDFAPITGAAIAKGSTRAYTEILGLTSSSGQTLQSFLAALPTGVSLVVTGHSLGGNAASVLLPWIASNISAFGGNGQPITGLPPNLVAVTFAAPTASNKAFADFLDAQSANYFACFNENDVVPHVWALTGPLRMEKIYSLFPDPGPHPAPHRIKLLLDAKISDMKQAKVSYTQTGGTYFKFPTISESGKEEKAWLDELSYQHNYAYCDQYLKDGPKCTA